MKAPTIGNIKFLAVLLILCACQSLPATIGSGPIKNPERLKGCLAEYLSYDKPLALAYAEDGSYCAWMYCPDVACGGIGSYQTKAISLCENRANSSCRIYAIRDQVVWKDAGPIDGKYDMVVDYSLLPQWEGSLQVAGSLKENLQKYKADLLTNPNQLGAFALATDGSWSYRLKEIKGSQTETRLAAAKAALNSCASHSKYSKDCSLILDHQLVVSNGSSLDELISGAGANSTSKSSASQTPRNERVIEVQWTRFPGEIHGTVNLSSGNIQIRTDSGLECNGTDIKKSSETTGFWTVKCDDGTSAQGSYRSLGPGKGAVGVGIDNEGYELRYVIGPKQ